MTSKAEQEWAYCRNNGVPHKDLSIAEEKGEKALSITTDGLRILMVSLAAQGNAEYRQALMYTMSAEEALVQEGSDPTNASRAAIMDALEVYGLIGQGWKVH